MYTYVAYERRWLPFFLSWWFGGSGTSSSCYGWQEYSITWLRLKGWRLRSNSFEDVLGACHHHSWCVHPLRRPGSSLSWSCKNGRRTIELPNFPSSPCVFNPFSNIFLDFHGGFPCFPPLSGLFCGGSLVFEALWAPLLRKARAGLNTAWAAQWLRIDTKELFFFWDLEIWLNIWPCMIRVFTYHFDNWGFFGILKSLVIKFVRHIYIYIYMYIYI